MRRIWRRKELPETTMTNAEAKSTENTAAVAEQGAHVAPERASSKKGASQKKVAKAGKKATPKKQAKASKKAAKPAAKREAGGAREGGKKAAVIAMLQCKGGAILEQIMKTTGWQKHTVRGFISILGSKHGLKIQSTKREDGGRVYAMAQSANALAIFSWVGRLPSRRFAELHPDCLGAARKMHALCGDHRLQDRPRRRVQNARATGTCRAGEGARCAGKRIHNERIHPAAYRGCTHPGALRVQRFGGRFLPDEV